MSKAIQSMEAITSAGALRNSACKRAGPDEAGGFSRLMSADQAEHTEHTEPKEAQTVPESGKNLPDGQHRSCAGDRPDPDTETASAGAQDAAPMPEGPQQDVALRVEQPLTVVSAQPVELTDAATSGAAVPAGPAIEITLPPGQVARQDPPAAVADGVPAVDALPVNSPADAPLDAGAADAAQATTVAAGPVAQVAANLLQAGREHPEGIRSRPGFDPVGHAVREGVMQMLASRTAQGGGGDALASGNNEQAATYEQAAAARETATGILSFADALLATGSTTPSARVAVPVGQPGWGRAVGEQVVWHVAQNIQSASLKLNPQHLGPLELQLHMDGDKASIAFASQHAAVREALESSLPRLRDMLAEQGLNLVNVNVSQHDAGSRREHASGGNRAGASARTASVEELLPVAGGMPGTITGRGLVDYYV